MTRAKQTVARAIFTFVLLVSVFLMSATVFARNDYIFEPDEDASHDEWPTFAPSPTPTPAPVTITSRRAWSNDMLSERTLSRRQEGLDIRNPIPDMTPIFGAGYDLINEQINEVVTHMISEARRVRARDIAFDFEHYVSGDIVSIVIYAEVSSAPPRTLVRSVNFSLTDGQLLTMNDAMGMNIIPLTERILADKIRRDPARYYVALSAPLTSQAFYMTGGASSELVLLFDGFRLSSSYGGIDSIRINRNSVRTTTITISDYHWRHNGYSLMMIPIGHVGRELGYSVTWMNGERRVDISRNGRTIIEIWPDENNFVVVGVRQRSLEAAPEMRNNLVYVPITFFDQIFPLTTYSVDPMNGSITFIAYLDSTI